MGDSAYTDFAMPEGSSQDDQTWEGLEEQMWYWFNDTYQDPFYLELMKETKIIGIWDDHDYGINNGDSSFEFKENARDIYLNFIGEPNDTDRRTQAGTGIYQDYVVTYGDKKVHILLIDNRYDYDIERDDRLG